MAQPEKISREEIDSMIKTCIGACKKGEMLSEKQERKFIEILVRVSTLQKFIYVYTIGERYPHAILGEALWRELVVDPAQKEFIVKQIKPLLDIESSLNGLMHQNRTFNEFINQHYGRTVQERWPKLGAFAGLNFSPLLKIVQRQNQLGVSMHILKHKLREPGLGRHFIADLQKELKTLRRRRYYLKGELEKKVQNFTTIMKAHFELAQPDARGRLVMALKEDGGKRQLTILQKYLQAFDRARAIRRPRVK